MVSWNRAFFKIGKPGLVVLSLLLVIEFSFALTQEEILREIIVMFKPGVVQLPEGSIGGPLDQITISSDVDSLLNMYGAELITKAFPDFAASDTLGVTRKGKIMRRTDLREVYKIRLYQAENRDTLISELSNLPEVIYAELNGPIELLGSVYPNDEHFSKQWGLYNTGQALGVPGADIDAPKSWEISTGSAEVKIGIVDNGIYSHPDLDGKVSGDEAVWDVHGTEVAGIAAAQANNEIGIAGVDWHARLVSAAFEGRVDPEEDPENIDGCNAVIRAVWNYGADIINCSWGMSELRYEFPRTLRIIFADLYRANRIAVASAGNDWPYCRRRWPAAFGQGVIVVGATTNSDGKASYSAAHDYLDVTAPGGESYPSASGIYTTGSGNGYHYSHGTSEAAPFASGLAGLLLAEKPDLDNDDVEQIIRLSADDKGASGWDELYGTGRINARRALELTKLLYHWTENGGSEYSHSDPYASFLFCTSGLNPDKYIVQRYEVRKTVNFPVSFDHPPYVWGRGVSTSGYSDNPTFGVGWCGVIPGTITKSGCTLKTYVFKVWDVGYDFRGWYPCKIQDVMFSYTVMAPPPPSYFTVSANCFDVATLNWHDDSEFEEGINIYRDGSYLCSVEANVSSYTDPTVTPGEEYSYCISYINPFYPDGESNFSKLRSVTVGVPNPSGISIYAISRNWLGIRWSDTPCENGFRIERQELFGNEWTDWHQIASFGQDVTSWCNTGLASNITYCYRVRAYNDYGSSAYSIKQCATTGSPGCPYVFTWDGEGYMEENNLLPASELPENEGKNVHDYYHLQQSLVPKDGEYQLVLQELEDDISYLDQVQLIAVDHQPGTNIVVDDSGMILGYTRLITPLSAIDTTGLDHSKSIKDADSLFFRGREGDQLVIKFSQIKEISGVGIVLGGEPDLQLKESVPPYKWDPVLMYDMWKHTGGKGISFRSKRYVGLVSWTSAFEDGILLRWQMPYKLDFIGLVAEVDSIGIHECSLSKALHLTQGSVLESLLDKDNEYTVLASGEGIELSFSSIPQADDYERDFILVLQGYYLKGEVGVRSLSREDLPETFMLFQNYPNPFNPITEIKYILPKSCQVRLEVYNLLGQKVATLVDKYQKAGYKTARWDASSFSSGIYFYRLQAGDFVQTRKMVLIR